MVPPNPTAPPMPAADAVGIYADAVAAAIALPLLATDRDEVIAVLGFVLAQARLVLDFPLPERMEAAGMFRP